MIEAADGRGDQVVPLEIAVHQAGSAFRAEAALDPGGGAAELGLALGNPERGGAKRRICVKEVAGGLDGALAEPS